MDPMDNLDVFSKFKTIQGINQSNQQLDGLKKELKETRNRILKYEADQRRRRESEERKPVCPWCGGRFEQGFIRCKHCSEEIVWVGEFFGKPEQLEELEKKHQEWEEEQSRLDVERKKLREQEEQFRKAEREKAKAEVEQRRIKKSIIQDAGGDQQKWVSDRMFEQLVLHNPKAQEYITQQVTERFKPLLGPAIALPITLLLLYMWNAGPASDPSTPFLLKLFGGLPAIGTGIMLISRLISAFGGSEPQASRRHFYQSAKRGIERYLRDEKQIEYSGFISDIHTRIDRVFDNIFDTMESDVAQ